MNLQPFRLLIVGAGLTGSVTAALIKQHFQTQVEIHVWEKSRGIGGRMTTHTAQANDRKSSVDLGAQYITRTGQYAKRHEKFFHDLFQAGVLKSFPGEIDGASVDDQSENFMAPNGINSIVTHFFNSSGAHLKLETLCTNISLSDKGDTSCWRATANDGASEEFHGIIVTIPVPQLLKLDGTFQDCLKKHHSSLQKVQYSSRYALALYFPEDTHFDVPWTAKYIRDNPCIRFVSNDGAKREKASEASFLVHTSVPFGLEHLDFDIEEVEKTIYGHFQELFPGFPRPLTTRCIRWRYSQVYKSFPGQPGAVVVQEKPLLVLAGDAFVHSNFSGCIESSLVAFEKFQEHIKTLLL